VDLVLKGSSIADWFVENMNPDMTPNRLLLVVSASTKKTDNKHLILIRIYELNYKVINKPDHLFFHSIHQFSHFGL
jgi:hypothetical protein